jgi:hypothetical protein
MRRPEFAPTAGHNACIKVADYGAQWNGPGVPVPVQAPAPHPAHETQRDPFGHCESLVHQQGTPAALHDPVEEVTSSQLPSEQDHAFATDAVVWQPSLSEAPLPVHVPVH